MALDRPVHAPETVDGTAAPAAHGDFSTDVHSLPATNFIEEEQVTMNPTIRRWATGHITHAGER
jgi:hypothetical protein